MCEGLYFFAWKANHSTRRLKAKRQTWSCLYFIVPCGDLEFLIMFNFFSIAETLKTARINPEVRGMLKFLEFTVKWNFMNCCQDTVTCKTISNNLSICCLWEKTFLKLKLIKRAQWWTEVEIDKSTYVVCWKSLCKKNQQHFSCGKIIDKFVEESTEEKLIYYSLLWQLNM